MNFLRSYGDAMICILSQSSLEPTTESVMDWLRSWKVPHVRLNGGDVDSVQGPMISVNNSGARIKIIIDGETIDPTTVKVVWYRRWHHNSRHNHVPLLKNEADRTKLNTIMLFMHLRGELAAVTQTLFSAFKSASWLGSDKTSSMNKLEVLQLAASLGLDIPDTLVTTSVDELRDFVRKHGEVVTKAAGEILLLPLDGTLFSSYTEVVPSDFLGDNPWKGGFPSLFQERLAKKYEVRIFYLEGRFYSMAMFTQRKTETQVDFRRYTYKDPARCVPYKLAADVEEKLHALMGALKLETGSIDMVQTKDSRLVFLEVNPVGQFGMVSGPCNYFLEREVARSLAKRLYGKE